jgi:hypothetical protein
MSHPDLIELASIEDIISEIVNIIRVSQASRPGPVQMTYVGGQFGKIVGVPFEQYVNYIALSKRVDIPRQHRKMVPFIKAYSGGRLIVEELPSGTFTIDEAEAAAPPGESNEAPLAADRQIRFKKGVWLAFIRPLEAGKRRYLNLNDRAGFTDVPGAASDPAWKEVERSYILGIPQDQLIDPPQVVAQITAWAQQKDIPLGDLHERAIAPRLKSASLADLARIIDCLPSDVTAQWFIPADVIRHLRK